MFRAFALLGCLVVVGCAATDKDNAKSHADNRRASTATAYLLPVKIFPHSVEDMWGSGFVNSIENTVFTNFHVMALDTKAVIEFPSGTQCTATRILPDTSETGLAIVLETSPKPDIALLQLEDSCTFADEPLWSFGSYAQLRQGVSGTLYGYAKSTNMFNIRLNRKKRFSPRNRGCACYVEFTSDNGKDPNRSSGGAIVVNGKVIAVMVGTEESNLHYFYAIPIEDALEALGLT
jgi:hypothetical protein